MALSLSVSSIERSCNEETFTKRPLRSNNSLAFFAMKLELLLLTIFFSTTIKNTVEKAFNEKPNENSSIFFNAWGGENFFVFCNKNKLLLEKIIMISVHVQNFKSCTLHYAVCILNGKRGNVLTSESGSKKSSKIFYI